jgi:hypothetical protein
VFTQTVDIGRMCERGNLTRNIVGLSRYRTNLA